MRVRIYPIGSVSLENPNDADARSPDEKYSGETRAVFPAAGLAVGHRPLRVGVLMIKMNYVLD